MQLVLQPKTCVMGVEYLGILKQGVNRVYSPAKCGTTSSDLFSFIADVMLVQPRVEFILSFIDHIAGDEDHTDGVVACAAGLIG